MKHCPLPPHFSVSTETSTEVSQLDLIPLGLKRWVCASLNLLYISGPSRAWHVLGTQEAFPELNNNTGKELALWWVGRLDLTN